MNKISSVTFLYVLRALEKICEIKIDDMLVYVNLEKSTIEDAEAQIDSIKLSKIFKYCMHKSDDLTLTLKIGNSITYHSLGVLGYLIQNTSNLKELIEKFSHYQKLISGFMKFHLEKDNKYYKLIIYINENPTIQVPSFHAEVHLAAILSILSQIIGKEILPDKVFFTIDKLSNKKEYEKCFGKNIFVAKDENAIFFENKKLDIKIENSNPIMLKYFEQQADKLLKNLELQSWYSKVKKEIFKLLSQEEITIDLISKRLLISTRTLQYYLKDEDKKFRDALIDVRMELANYYIKNKKMDLGTISYFLGYKDSSSFFRAYKKYYKKTPKEFISEGLKLPH